MDSSPTLEYSTSTGAAAVRMSNRPNRQPPDNLRTCVSEAPARNHSQPSAHAIGSSRSAPDLLRVVAERGIAVDHVTVCRWVPTFTAPRNARTRQQCGDRTNRPVTTRETGAATARKQVRQETGWRPLAGPFCGWGLPDGPAAVEMTAAPRATSVPLRGPLAGHLVPAAFVTYDAGRFHTGRTSTRTSS
jgi:hypothetical protein